LRSYAQRSASATTVGAAASLLRAAARIARPPSRMTRSPNLLRMQWGASSSSRKFCSEECTTSYYSDTQFRAIVAAIASAASIPNDHGRQISPSTRREGRGREDGVPVQMAVVIRLRPEARKLWFSNVRPRISPWRWKNTARRPNCWPRACSAEHGCSGVSRGLTANGLAG
jgi:hypothetical protein